MYAFVLGRSDEPGMAVIPMSYDLRAHVEALEAACHRVLQGHEVAESVQAMAQALDAFDLPFTTEDPTIIRGLSKVACRPGIQGA